MYEDREESVLIQHEPCPQCGSKDNLGRYSDGHGYCFGCGYYERGDGEIETSQKRNGRVSEDLLNGDFSALPKRGLSEETCRMFGYRVGSFQGKPVQVADYRNEDGNRVAQKLRFKDKSEGMPWLGSPKEGGLFGQHLWGRGKRIVITEGEIDCLTVSQMQGNKWPVVSLKNGADKSGKGVAKELAKHIEYLSKFDEIVLMFDMDEPGRSSAKAAAEVLPPGRVKIASLPLKDANDCLMNGKAEAIVPAIWNAKPVTPDSIVSGEEIWTRLQNRPDVTSYPFPDWLPELNAKVLGLRLGDLTTWTSGSGMGKTTIIRQLQHHYHQTTDFNQALIMLEEPLEDTAEGMIGLHLGKRLELPHIAESVSDEDMRAAFEELFLSTDDEGNNRIHLYDAFGSVEEENLYAKIRFFAQGCGCKIIWLDHLSILVSNMGDDGDERRRIDSIMHNLKNLTVELNISINLIVHLKKASGNGPSFEEGGIPSLDDLRGSGGIKQLSNNVFALSRNQQSESDVGRNTSRVHSLKCRRTGETGPADFILFDRETGLMTEGVDPEMAEGFSDETCGSLRTGHQVPTITEDGDEIPF